MILLLFGLGMPAKVAFGALHGIIPVVLFTMNAVRNVNRTYLRAGRAMRLTPAQTGWHILIPATLPEIFSGLRIGFSLTLLGTMLGELFASQRGLGFLLMTAIDLHDVKTILSIAVLISAFAVIANAALLADRQASASRAAPEAHEKHEPASPSPATWARRCITRSTWCWPTASSTGRYAAGEPLPTEEQLTQHVQRLAHHGAPRHGQPARAPA